MYSEGEEDMYLQSRFQIFRQAPEGSVGSGRNHGSRGRKGLQNTNLQVEKEAGRGIVPGEDNRIMITTIDLALVFQEITKISFTVMYEDCRKDNEFIHLRFMWTGVCRFFKRSYPQIAKTIRKDHSTCVFYYKRHLMMMDKYDWYSESYLLLLDDTLDRFGV